jgi:hypothetical protein
VDERGSSVDRGGMMGKELVLEDGEVLMITP